MAVVVVVVLRVSASAVAEDEAEDGEYLTDGGLDVGMCCE